MMMEVSSPPEYAKTTFLGNGFSLGEQRVQDRLLDVQAICRLIVNNGARGINDAFGDLKTAVGGQAVQEDSVRRGLREKRFVHLICRESFLARSRFSFLAHARPDVGVDGLGSGDGVLGRAQDFDL